MKRTAALLPLFLFLTGCETIPEADTPSMGARYTMPSPSVSAAPSLAGSYHTVRGGETLWRISRSYGLDARQLAAANRLSSSSHLRVGQRLFIPLPAESRQFLWPVRGRVARTSSGLQIIASRGSLVRASRSGRVAVATHHLSGWGKTVILDHFDGYLTVYAGLEQMLVAPGANIRQGLPIGSLGTRALHFEIRYGSAPRNAVALLPRE